MGSALETVRERPAATLFLVAGSAALAGYFAGRWVALHGGWRALNSPQPRENGTLESGTSTPRISGSGTPRLLSAGELEFKLDCSLALIFRGDLSLGRGRLATLCSQATVGQFKKLHKAGNEDLKIWERSNAVKVCLQAEDEAQLLHIERAAREAGLPTFTVKDAQNNRRVRSVMAVGPAENSRIQAATQGLKLVL